MEIIPEVLSRGKFDHECTWACQRGLLKSSIGFQIQKINGDLARPIGKIFSKTTVANAIFPTKSLPEEDAADRKRTPKETVLLKPWLSSEIIIDLDLQKGKQKSTNFGIRSRADRVPEPRLEDLVPRPIDNPPGEFEIGFWKPTNSWNENDTYLFF